MNVYLLSGLGADKRVFSKLNFLDKYVIRHLEWIDPKPGEGLPQYAKRISEKIDLQLPFILIGVSFGGMLAVEIARFINPLQTIIISSAASSSELPWYFKVAGKLRLHMVAPEPMLKSANIATYWFFGVKTADEKILLKQILADTDTRFLRWAINSILNWKQLPEVANVFHIHGTTDKILPLKYTHADLTVSNGGHLMIYTHAEVISEMLEERLGIVDS